METATILKNLDNGTITQDAALELILEHAPQAYLAGSFLECRTQCADYRTELHALQDRTQESHMRQDVLIDLIDHAFLTDHYGPNRTHAYLVDIGMNDETAKHHIETIGILRGHDRERKTYLDNPAIAPRYCTRCGRKVHADELSRRALCVECSSAAVEENLIALDTKTGPVYNRWRNAMLVWAYTLEDQEIAERANLDTAPIADLIDHNKAPSCLGDGCNDDTCQWFHECIETERDASGEPF